MLSPDALPEFLLAPDLYMRPPTDDEQAARGQQLAPYIDARIIEVRATGRPAGVVGYTANGIWIEMDPEHRRRGRGVSALATWLRAVLDRDGEAVIPPGISPIAQDFLRRFSFRPQPTGHWTSSEATAQRLADLRHADERRYDQRTQMICVELDIPIDYARVARLPLCLEPTELRSIENDIYDRPQRLHPAAAAAWDRMRDAAAKDDVELQVVSAFRSLEYQAGLIRRKLEAGQSLGSILAVSAAPGFSEHHTGRAVDLTTPGAKTLEESFEDTAAFAWLKANAAAHGFRMSYPRENPHGVAYEPWHWFCQT